VANENLLILTFLVESNHMCCYEPKLTPSERPNLPVAFSLLSPTNVGEGKASMVSRGEVISTNFSRTRKFKAIVLSRRKRCSTKPDEYATMEINKQHIFLL
jgi:hypothetical protein